MTLREAAARGIERVRLPNWALPNDYLKLRLIPQPNGEIWRGPWGELYSPLQRDLGVDRPQQISILMDTNDLWEPYTGELFEETA